MSNNGITLGSIVKDNITGFTGVVITRASYLNGCVSYHVQPQKLDKEGKKINAEWFDVEQLTVVEEKKVASEPSGGGVREYPPQ